MKTNLLINWRTLLPFLVSIFIWCALLFLTTSEAFYKDLNLLSNAVTIDLFLTVPLVYFFLIRKTAIPNLSVIPIFLLSMWIGLKILPEEGQVLFSVINDHKIYIAELLFIWLESAMVYGIWKNYQKVKRGYYFFKEDIYSACSEYFGSNMFSSILAGEISIFYYLLKKREIPQAESFFTYHKRSNLKTLTIFFSIVIFIESVIVHFLISRWNIVVSWIFTLSSIYLLFFIISHYKACLGLPIIIGKESLTINNGILARLTIPFNDIQEIKEVSYNENTKYRIWHLHPLGELGSFNLLLILNKKHSSKGLFGIRKEFEGITLEIDDKASFISRINKHLDQRIK